MSEFDRVIDREPQKRLLSIVLPVLDEAEGLAALVDELRTVPFEDLDLEIVIVDDGSRDGSLDVALALRRHDDRVRVVALSRNFGHQAALLAGLRHATGDAVVLMDADGQDPPHVVGEMVRRWQDGHEVVYGIRRSRRESWAKRTAYSLFYRLLSRMSDVDIPRDAGDFSLLDRVVVNALLELPESTLFLRGLRAWVGFRQVGVAYDRPGRIEGSSSYSVRKLVSLATDGVLSFSAVPLRVASWLGFFTSFAGVVYLCVAVVARVSSGEVPKGWTSIVALVLLIGGAQLFVIGVLGEYLARVFKEAKRRPPYVVARRWP